MNEFNLLSQAEKIAYCHAQLRRMDELEAELAPTAWSPDKQEALRVVESTRRQVLDALHTLEKPSLWRRINQAVNDAAARSQVKEDLKRRGRTIRCVRCGGSGRRVADYGNYFTACECRGVTHVYQGDDEIDRARRAAAELRNQI